MIKPRIIDIKEGTELELYSDRLLMHIGKFTYGASANVNDQTLNNAEELGYKRTFDGVFASLVESEVLHTLVSRFVYRDKDSLVLLQNAGRKVDLPRWKKLHSEAIVMALQYYLNTHICLAPLDPWLTLNIGFGTMANVARSARELIDLVPLLPIEEKQRKTKSVG